MPATAEQERATTVSITPWLASLTAAAGSRHRHHLCAALAGDGRPAHHPQVLRDNSLLRTINANRRMAVQADDRSHPLPE